MRTEYYVVDSKSPDEPSMQAAAEVIRRGGLVAFPTETVYGLGADGLNEDAVAKIFQAKGRPADNPLILHIAATEELEALVKSVPPKAKTLMERFWPGPLTLVLPRTDLVPDAVTGGLDTVAVRMPDSIVARRLIELAGVPLAAPSANVSGRPSPTDAQAVAADLDGRVDVILDAGACRIGLESTVVDCSAETPILLRPGGITREMLAEAVGTVNIDPAIGAAVAVPRSPGMKYTHYAPAAPMRLVEETGLAGQTLLRTEIRRELTAGRRVGAVVCREMAAELPDGVVAAVYGSRLRLREIAAGLYSALRYFDEHPVDIIYAEGVDEAGLGLAVMNRLRKAAGHDLVRRKFRVLFVCTGNTCRSPMAAALLNQQICQSGWEGRIEASSAGLAAGRGPASAGAFHAMAERGIDLQSHRARPLTDTAVGEADLILTMTAGHQREIGRYWPPAAEKTFTVTEFAVETGDVADPFAGDTAVYRLCAGQLLHCQDKFWPRLTQLAGKKGLTPNLKQDNGR
ncbi:MAG TPA: L-threonylcarbamoyladenylate synthase [Patescibacteria group bacterium]|nr:L-threonylcarbamoyladenylate synthase [Patescibacteria group bacterium]